MKKRQIFITLLLIALLTVSCFNKNKDKNNGNQQTTEAQNGLQGGANTDIFNLGAGDQNTQNNIDNLTPEEQNLLISNNIDPSKVSEAIKSAESGDKEAILSLSQLYYSLKDTEKTKKYLQMGVNRNYPEAIYNLAILYKEEGNMTEANKLIAKLPQDMKVTNNLPAGAAEYNKGIEYVKAKNYKLAKAEFEKAYNKGIKDADMKIAVLNKELKNSEEALKWFKLAANRGVKEANLEVGAILYDSGKTTESRPYLQKAYNSGNKALAMPIAISYHKENNVTEALKWYKIAAKNGDKDAQSAVNDIENAGKKIQGNNLFLGDNNTSLIDKTLDETSLENNNTQKEETKVETQKTETKKRSTDLQIGPKKSELKSTENTTSTSNVKIDEVINDQVTKYKE